MKPSIWTSAYHPLEPEEAVERLARVGWRCIEFSDEHWRKLAGRPDPEGEFRKMRGLLEKLGVRAPQMHGPMFNACDPDRRRVEENVKLTKQVLRWAALMGVEWVVLHPGDAPMADDEEAERSVMECNLRRFGELLEVAKEVGVGIAVENTWDHGERGRRSFGSVPSELLRLVRSLDPDRVGICWDTGHAHLQGLDQYRAIRALGGHLVATHIADNHGNYDEHFMPFEGTVNWTAVMRALREIGYSGPFNFEVGGALEGIPLRVRDAKVGYALELCTAMVEGRVP